MKKLIVFLITIIFASGVSAANLSNYKLHNSSNGVALYYKVDDYGITFKVKNSTGQTVHVLVENVSANWTDGKTRSEDVQVTYANPGKVASARYDHADNYSKMQRWSFSGWRWSTDYSDIN